MFHFRSPDIGPFGRRQRHARGHRVPVTIVEAFAAPEDGGTAVIIDTFGPHDIIPLGPCRCCTVRVELQTALRRRLTGRAQRPFTRVVIETGEDPGPILRTFATGRALGAEFYVEEAPAAASTRADFCRFVLTEDAPLRWDAFSRFITTLMALRGADLLHVQGLLNVSGCRGPVAVRFTHHLAHAPVELQAWPDDDRTSRIAFVTRDVGKEAVRNMFDAVRALSEQSLVSCL